MSLDSDKPLRGLYVHVPFCSVKCFYCDFTAFSGQRGIVKRYLAALESEAGLRHGQMPRVDTLYIGGGTPSELDAGELAELFRILAERFGPIGDLQEVTVEANPESLAPDKLAVLRQAGVTRISLGLQTAQPHLLKAIGRRHSIEDFERSFNAARELGFSMNVDLMIGLPTQTFEDAMQSLERVFQLGPDHISQYCLQIEDQTLFAKRGTEVGEDLCRVMFEQSLDRLASAGFRHYEISNFAVPGHESVHNMIYWKDGEYLGLGCGASGHVGGERYSNVEKLKNYCEMAEAGGFPQENSERLAGREKLGETLFVGLRLIGGTVVSREMEQAFATEFKELVEQGLIERSGNRAKLTRNGIFLANRVFSEFVPPFRSEPAAV